MELDAFIGLLSSVITIEEAGRSWLGIVKKYVVNKKKINFDKIESEDPVVQSALDKIKSDLSSLNSEMYELTENDINVCKKKFQEQLPHGIGYQERREIDFYINELINELKVYLKKQMSVGERIIYKEVCATHRDIANLSNKINMNAESRFDDKIISEIYVLKAAKHPSAQFSFRENEICEIVKVRHQYFNICIHGIGGIGKSSILKYLYHNLEDKQLIPVWIEYSGELEYDLLAVLVMPDNLNMEERKQYLKKYIDVNKDRLIFFIDNVDERFRKDEYLEIIEGKTRIIVTSRLESITDSFYMYKINALTNENAIKLFWMYYGRTKEESNEVVDKMLAKVKYHTLLIELLAKAAKFSDESLECFYETLLKNGYGVIKERIETAYDGLDSTLVEHITMLFSIMGMDKLEKKILKNFAITPNEPLPSDFKKWIIDDEIDDAVTYQKLICKGWLTKTEANLYEMHPVMKEAILLQENPKIEDVKELLNIMTSEWWLSPNDNTLETFLSRFSIVESFVKYFSVQESVKLQVLISLSATSLMSYCMYDKARKYLNINLENDLKQYGIESRIVARDYLNIARVCNESNELEEAEMYSNRAISILKDDDLETKRLKHDVIFLQGTIYAKQGRFAEAKQSYDKVSEMDDTIADEEDRTALEVNIFALMINSGQFHEAHMVLNEVMEKVKKNFDEDSWEMALFYQNCANLYFNDMNYEMALKYDEYALNIREKKQVKHTATAQSYFSVAYDLFVMNNEDNIEQCIVYAQKSYEIYKELLGKDDRDTENVENLLEVLKCKK